MQITFMVKSFDLVTHKCYLLSKAKHTKPCITTHFAEFNANIEINHKHHNEWDIEYIPTEIGFHTNWILNYDADKSDANNFGAAQFSSHC